MSMEIEQAHMDVYTLGATKEGTLDWSERDDRLGVVEVLNLIDPVPAEMNTLTDNTGERWSRFMFDPMIWVRVSDSAHLTAGKIRELFDIKEWSAE